jgi:bifunctional oligoribonuclease and PAP phosphatase NrnA
MFQRIKDIVDKGNRFLVTSHVDPDGDAIGSAFAMSFALTGLGKEPTVYLKDRVPYRYQFLPQPSRLIHEMPETNGFDAVFVLDCGDLFRVGKGHEALKKVHIVNIDHHNENAAFGQLNILDERASSTAEVLYQILKAIDAPFSMNVAVNLYTAVLTDTGSFRYDSTTIKAFSICEEMASLGVVPSYVATRVYESHPKERFSLFCLALSTMEMFKDDRVAVAHVTEEMFNRTGTDREFTEGFVEELKKIGGVEVACFFRQVDAKKYKVSMRSKGEVDVALVARMFGGGGHKKAAGCTVEGDIEGAKARVVEALGL